MTGCLPAAIGG